MKYDLGIVGGLGPLASSYLYELITKNTKARKDQEHLNIVILSHPTIPDRTAYIIGDSSDNPYPYLLEDCITLQNMGVKMISIPCNTSCYFHEKLQGEIDVPINNLIKNTVKYIKDKGYKKVAILATEGTIKSHLYQNELDKNGIDYLCPKNDEVMEIIYDYIKCGKDVDYEKVYNITKDTYVDAIILGCTELSILKGKLNLGERYIDPLEIEVKNILDFFNKGR